MNRCSVQQAMRPDAERELAALPPAYLAQQAINQGRARLQRRVWKGTNDTGVSPASRRRRCAPAPPHAPDDPAPPPSSAACRRALGPAAPPRSSRRPGPVGAFGVRVMKPARGFTSCCHRSRVCCGAGLRAHARAVPFCGACDGLVEVTRPRRPRARRRGVGPASCPPWAPA